MIFYASKKTSWLEEKQASLEMKRVCEKKRSWREYRRKGVYYELPSRYWSNSEHDVALEPIFFVKLQINKGCIMAASSALLGKANSAIEEPLKAVP